MLSPEQAKARLAEWRLPEEQNRLKVEVARLPAALRELAEDAFELREDGDSPRHIDWQSRHQLRRQATLALDRQALQDRAEVFATIAPQLAPAMEQTWQLLKTTPYQSGYRRKAFRAPGRSELAIDNLATWLSGMQKLGERYQAGVLTPTWLAAWAAHLDENYDSVGMHLGPLLAAALNENDASADEIFDILRQSLSNQHEIGAAGRHVYTALLLSNRTDGWELIEKTLLAAQRQEGLRQAILEAVDVTHPEAFRRMLRLILDHDLFRFSAVTRAVDVWFGQLWASASTGVIKKMLTQVVQFLEDPAERKKALQGKDAEAAFLALWCEATEDAAASVPLAAKLLKVKSVELRYVAARHLVNLDLDEASAALVPAIDDEDLRVAQLALRSDESDEHPRQDMDGRFERIERLVGRVSEKPQKLKPIVWPWTETTIERSQVAGILVHSLGKRPPTRLIAYLPILDPSARFFAVHQLVGTEPWDEATRQAIVKLAGDAAANVRASCLAALAKRGVLPAEIPSLESYLTRKASDLRRGVLTLLLQQEDSAALASSRRLLDSKDANQRLAGLELLRLLGDARRSIAQCRQAAAAYQAARKKITKEEQSHLDEIAKEKVAVATLDDALGLMNPAERTPVTPPRNLQVPFITAAAVACLQSLDDLVHEHRETPIQHKDYFGSVQEALLGTIGGAFPGPAYGKPGALQRHNLPLADVWLKWDAERAGKLRDADDLELLRAHIWGELSNRWDAEEWTRWAKSSAERKRVAERLSGGHALSKLRYGNVVADILDWLLFLSPQGGHDYLFDALETAYALVPATDMAKLAEPPKTDDAGHSWHDRDDDWRTAKAYEMWADALSEHLNRSNQELTPKQIVRHWGLMHWRDQPFEGAPRLRVKAELLLGAYAHKAATLADVTDHLLAPRGKKTYGFEGFDLLAALTAKKLPKQTVAWLAKHPEIGDLVQRAVARILDLELSRGDSPTAATHPAHYIEALPGIATLRRILHALGSADFKVGHSWRTGSEEDRRQTITTLAKVTCPAEQETLDDFTRIMKAAVAAGEFPEERLLQLAFLAPQWTRHVEAYLGWPQMSEGVYWFLAHMRYVWGLGESAAEAAGIAEPVGEESADAAEDSGEESPDGQTPVSQTKKLSAWERLILERTPLTDEERGEGAIDVAWFQRTHELLGAKRWQALAAAARFAANPAQAKRAQFIADVLLNRIKRQELITGIKKKQLKDHVRLLGLLPLATGNKREADLVERCQVLREYRRYANQLSGLTKPAALRAWEIGMKNLAQMAGFADPLRLEWAIGGDAVKDLAKGPVKASKDGVTVTLALDELSKPEITVHKGNKELKSIPPAIKKDKRIAELASRATDLKRQASAIRQSLEAAMCRGDCFTGDELRKWCNHAQLAPLLSRLVVVGEGILGYPDKGGRALRDFRGKFEPVKSAEQMRLAHPHDLLESGAWHAWQRECFQAERMQPFKQVFRELYVVTKQEKKDGAISHRYDGQQIQPNQALALFGTRGWDTRDGVFKVFHDLGLIANVHFKTGVATPLEVEGWTLAGVSFTPRDQWKPISLKSAPPRLFSEVMRDLDLVVSVAHAGGVDPEASASTVEMRAGLLRETCSLLKLKNVRLKPAHAVIDGELASYSVHLGSGVVHTMPGGSLCLVPVHAQHRGRLFLPFADDDPRTAEVVSKVLLLARDHEIQDPAILEQIRR